MLKIVSMPETLKPISDWYVAHKFATNIVAELIKESASQSGDVVNISGSIFCIPLNYDRVLVRDKHARSPNNIDHITYSLYTDRWKITLQVWFEDIALSGFESLKWTGEGDYDRWMRDATLLRLYGISFI